METPGRSLSWRHGYPAGSLQHNMHHDRDVEPGTRVMLSDHLYSTRTYDDGKFE